MMPAALAARVSAGTRRAARTLTIACAGLCACAHFPLNEPLARTDATYGYRISATSGDADDSRKLLLVVTFSGGGMRAAAFAYGALQALADTRVRFDGRERALVDEIDVISSVSGGSFTSAYFALHGRRIFEDFETRFLRRDVQGALLRRMSSPLSWVRLASPWFGRSDLAAEYYDELLFQGATLGDLLTGDGPALIINATDMTLATRFAFEQAQFDLLCSDSLRFPIARAVAASAAVPGLLSPISLRSYAAQGCGYDPPDWIREELAHGERSTRRRLEARRIAAHLAPGVEWVHLLDGALTDNLGLRLAIENAAAAGGYARLTAHSGFTRFRRVVYLVVNAQTDAPRQWSRSARSPGALSALVHASTVVVNRYNFETIDLLRQSLGRWVDELRKARCAERLDAAGCADVGAHLVEVSFAEDPDPGERAYLSALPTGLRLRAGDVRRVAAAARRVLSSSSAFRAALADLATRP
jgi:NTE family protein